MLIFKFLTRENFCRGKESLGFSLEGYKSIYARKIKNESVPRGTKNTITFNDGVMINTSIIKF